MSHGYARIIHSWVILWISVGYPWISIDKTRIYTDITCIINGHSMNILRSSNARVSMDSPWISVENSWISKDGPRIFMENAGISMVAPVRIDPDNIVCLSGFELVPTIKPKTKCREPAGTTGNRAYLDNLQNLQCLWARGLDV